MQRLEVSGAVRPSICVVRLQKVNTKVPLPNASCPHSSPVSLRQPQCNVALSLLHTTKSNQSHANSCRCSPLICARAAAILHCDNRNATQWNGHQTRRTDGRTDRHKEMCSAQDTALLRILAPCLMAIFQTKWLIPSEIPVKGENIQTLRCVTVQHVCAGRYRWSEA